jgi:hypothetical protein
MNRMPRRCCRLASEGFASRPWASQKLDRSAENLGPGGRLDLLSGDQGQPRPVTNYAEEGQHLPTPQSLAQNRRTLRINAVNLKNMLG